MGMLDGKVALITGGARGQGRAHALTCAREGADVVVVDIAEQLSTATYPMADQSDLDETAKLVEALDRRVLAIKADVRSQEQLDSAVSAALTEFDQIDILIANAGIWTQAPFWEITDAQWDETIGVNLTGVWKTVKAVTPHMIERERGSIVLISSVAGLESGANYAHYCSAKHGMIGLMQTIALELAPYGIRCNSISPGSVNTPMTNVPARYDMWAGHPGGTEEDFLKAGYSYSALKGVGWQSPQTIANTALYLNSDLAATVTGVTVPVDGGHLILRGVNSQPIID